MVAIDIVCIVGENQIARHVICFAWQRIASSSISVGVEVFVVAAIEILLAATEIPVAP